MFFAVEAKQMRYAPRNRIASGGVVLVAIVGGIVLWFFNPADCGLFPSCPFHSLTGLKCPGCGTLRALHQIIHGNISAGFLLNPLMFVCLPLLFWFVANHFSTLVRGRALPGFNTRAWVCGGVLAVVMVYWVVRNLVSW